MEPRKLKIFDFGELIEGKLYETENGEQYKKINGGLWLMETQKYSCLFMNYIMEMKFTEVVEYVDFKTAFTYMMVSENRRVEFDGRFYFIENSESIIETPLINAPASVTTDMVLEKKWILL